MAAATIAAHLSPTASSRRSRNRLAEEEPESLLRLDRCCHAQHDSLRGPLYNEVKEGAALLLSLREPPQPLLDQLTHRSEDVACSAVDLRATRRGREQLLPFGESCVLPIASESP